MWEALIDRKLTLTLPLLIKGEAARKSHTDRLLIVS